MLSSESKNTGNWKSNHVMAISSNMKTNGFLYAFIPFCVFENATKTFKKCCEACCGQLIVIFCMAGCQI